MRTSVRQWCRTLLAGCRYWISPFLGSASFLSRTALNMRGLRSACTGCPWTQACDLPSAEMLPISSQRMK